MLLTLLDFETTGLEPGVSELIEIGAIRVRVEPSGQLTEESRFATLVRPEGRIPPEIQRLTKITEESVKEAPAITEALPQLVDFLQGSVCIAHNAAMEQGFLNALYTLHRLGEPPRVINSIEPLALLLPEHASHSMESMRKWAGLSLEGSHRALEDCEALLAVLNFAQEFMRTERPWVPALLLGFLRDEAAWDWRWFFENPMGFYGLVDERPPEKIERGDLRELKRADERRNEAQGATAAESGPDSGNETTKIRTADLEAVLKQGAESQGLELRPQQLSMGAAVLEAQSRGGRVAIEAPTGTGKSLAYLLPGLLRARETGTPLVVSTHSKALQDQLIEKDIPKLEKLLGTPVRAATVKGQQNYLCLRKLDELLSAVGFSHSLEEKWASAYLAILEKVEPVVELEKISRYLRNLFPALDESIDRVRSSHTTTLGPPCPFYKKCHFFDSARIAHESEVIVANHALTFSWPGHLPQIRDLVLDEGHHLEDQLTQSLTLDLSEWELDEACERLARKQGARKFGDGVAIARLLDGVSFDDFVTRTRAIRDRTTELRSAASMWMPQNSEGGEGYEQSLVMNAGGGPGGSGKNAGRPLPFLTELRAAVNDLHVFLGTLLSRCDSQRNSLELDLLKTHV
ncbi:MAG: exonuclease domain-containing protein, partial [Oligoflexia bacterium]